MKNYLVTGGCGFIGNIVAEKLKLNGYNVYIIDDLSNSSVENPNGELFKCDIRDYESLDKVFEKLPNLDAIFHLAALARVQPSIEDPILFNNTNVNGTLNLLEMSKKYKVKKFIFSSSSSVYGNNTYADENDLNVLNPMSPYALQKLIGEQYCKLFSELYDIDCYCLRYFNVYGETMPLRGQYRIALAIFKEKFLNSEKLPITNDGEQTRDFVYVGDVAEANILCLNLTSRFEIFNVGTGVSHSINQIVKQINVEYEYIGEVIEPKNTLSNSDKLKKTLDWRPKGELNTFIQKYFCKI
jgi:nucleoside-diphosphate-sugar epimerase